MFKFTKTGVFVLAVIIVFLITQIFINNYKIENEINKGIMDIQCLDEIPIVENLEKNEVWYIEIPKISLRENISEGITKDEVNEYIGHFSNTSKEKGNIGLAFYNAGKGLKLLQKGDKIRYKHNNFEKIYEVEKCRIIRDNQWEYLEEDEDNMLTLITYIENQPTYRRCIQAIEII